ncbi:uncharacterized protein BDZ99DRAFT_572890 [Mytilinidion resinicola]|uniref:Uncharacterized protein n=1 Tax=Mytilinidion resinicola TaxID=574789 RepID=A0A6A6YGT6_9PEZI|nr:uncharacterized protein BDZ99DRAFT_572890 [Mytilinidion resinicola]KAF2808022.1 hypothetical protein BDZ99DRAFT_572890 [Mytilinidion resinicola]
MDPPQARPDAQLPPLKIYNSLTRSKDDFVPVDPTGKMADVKDESEFPGLAPAKHSRSESSSSEKAINEPRKAPEAPQDEGGQEVPEAGLECVGVSVYGGAKSGMRFHNIRSMGMLR